MSVKNVTAEKIAQQIGEGIHKGPLSPRAQKIVQVVVGIFATVVAFTTGQYQIFIPILSVSAGLFYHAFVIISPLDDEKNRQKEIEKIKNESLSVFRKKQDFETIIEKDLLGIKEEADKVKGEVGKKLEELWSDPKEIEKQGGKKMSQIVTELVSEVKEVAPSPAKKAKKILKPPTETKQKQQEVSNNQAIPMPQIPLDVIPEEENIPPRRIDKCTQITGKTKEYANYYTAKSKGYARSFYNRFLTGGGR